MQNPYDLIAERWDAGGHAFRQRRYVDLILEGLERGARVLDVGCGTGRPVAEYLVARGFHVVGIDSSEGMLEIARRAVPEAQFVWGDMTEAEFGEGFAAAVVWDSLFHVPRAQHAEVFRKLHAALVPAGRLLLSAGGTGDEGFTSEMYGEAFFYSGFAPEETVALIEGAGFRVELCEVDDPSSRGHVAVVARKDADRELAFTRSRNSNFNLKLQPSNFKPRSHGQLTTGDGQSLLTPHDAFSSSPASARIERLTTSPTARGVKYSSTRSRPRAESLCHSSRFS